MVHVFLDSEGVAWHPKQSTSKLPGFEFHFLCIVCQLTGRVKHKPVKLKIPSREFASFMRKAATPIKVACALLRLGMVAAKVASGGLVPIPLSILSPIEEMGALCDKMSEIGTNVVTFADLSVEESELGEEVNTQPPLVITSPPYYTMTYTLSCAERAAQAGQVGADAGADARRRAENRRQDLEAPARAPGYVFWRHGWPRRAGDQKAGKPVPLHPQEGGRSDLDQR